LLAYYVNLFNKLFVSRPLPFSSIIRGHSVIHPHTPVRLSKRTTYESFEPPSFLILHQSGFHKLEGPAAAGKFFFHLLTGS
jgi:hypothetical protein